MSFKLTFNQMQDQVYAIAVEKGWWISDRSGAECIALMHSELSEALEAMRIGNPDSTKIPGFSQLEEELADVIIRIMDYAGAHRLNVAGAIVRKVGYNASREFKHGKEF